MHGAVKGKSGFAGLVNVRDGFDKVTVLLMSKTMVVDDVVKTVRPTLPAQIGLAFGLIHLEENFEFGGYALIDTIAYDVPLGLVVMTTTAGYHKCLERLLWLILGKS